MSEPVVRQITLEELYLAAHERMVRVAFLITGSVAVAEELVHDAFAELMPRWDSIENPGGYLHRAVVNRCLSWRTRRRLEHDRLPRTIEPTRSSDPEIDETWDALSHLSRDQRAVVVLRFYADLTHNEIAEIVNCPPATVRSRLHRALAQLRKEIER